ncbi:MAG: hypothetical protein WDO15_22065 [Bacteroidota bacterium]
MEDLRGKFGVIVAGYTENMQGVRCVKPGITFHVSISIFYFEDYSPDEMHVIAMSNFR